MKDNHFSATCESAGAPAPAGMNSPPHLLVAEDDDSIRELNTEALRQAGYEVDAAADGAAAWQALQAASYDLLITDNNMPRISGVELLKHLRAVRMELPVIMATGPLPQHEFNRYPWLQPAATLLKPYTIEELLQSVMRVLREADGTGASRPRFEPQMAMEANNPVVGELAGAARQCPTNGRHRILVVEEDRDLRQLYAEALARADYDVDFAADGAAGWEALQAKVYHLLITEHEMPKLRGVELVRKVRAAHMALPVVLATGRLPAPELVQNPPLQLAATLMKPFAIDALLATVRTVLRTTTSPSAQIPSPSWKSHPATDGLGF